jgi:tRNA-splicing ligase RtcB
MAVAHKGYAVAMGEVVVYQDKISPSGVDCDIACGNKGVLTDADAGDVRENIATSMDDIFRIVSFGVGRKNDERVNHYVNVFTDEQDRVWIGVHFGSRGFGHKIATHFLAAGGAQDGMDVDPLVIDAESNLARIYLACMRLAGRSRIACARFWARTPSRRSTTTTISPGGKNTTANALGGAQGRHAGARSLFLDDSRRGQGDGADGGQGQDRPQTGEVKRAGKVTRQMIDEWMRQAGVTLRAAGAGEFDPYKD